VTVDPARAGTIAGPRPSRGRLRVYLGAAPGVGKTYAMLGEAHRRQARGTDVVVGFVQPYRRPQTEAMLDGLELLAPRVIEHDGQRFEEMDLEALLERHPAVAVVDELAHSNAPGRRHAKRWQDVHQLLDAGIDVVTTVNISDLESLHDVVESITGVPQHEPLPDSVVRAADQIELVDMSPESLRRRLAHGNVYEPEQVDAALGNYFRLGNLTALRELALLWVADRVDEGLERYRTERGIHQTWAARTRIVVALTGDDTGEVLLRRGALIAGRSSGRELLAVHVVRSDGRRGYGPDTLARLRQLTEDLGASFHTVVGEDVATPVLEFTRSVNGTQVVVGTSRRSRLSTALRPGTAELVVRSSGDIDVHVVTHGTRRPPMRERVPRVQGRRRRWAWPVAILMPVAIVLLLHPARTSLSLSTVLLAFLLGVVAASLVGGIAPAVVSSVEASLLANYYFAPPLGTLSVAAPENAFAIVVFVVVGVVVAAIVDRSAARAAEAARRGAEGKVLASLSLGVLRRQDGVRALLDHARETFGSRGAALFESTTDGRWSVVAVSGDQPPAPEQADVSLEAGPGLRLVLAGGPLPASDRRILEAFAAQAGAVLERNRLAARAGEAARLQETDGVRTALLAAVSHDLRTPLAAIKASVATLRDPELQVGEDDRRALLADAADSVDRLDSLVSNLLDLSRIQTGAVRPRLEPVSLDEVLQRALRGMPEHAVTDETDDTVPLLLTDAGLLERAVANLVENAVRHCPDRPVRLCAGVVPGDAVQLRIVDRGPGVPEADRQRMFEPFQRLGDVPQGSGVGLGLAVARGLSEAVGATLEADDTPGGGLTMVLTVPRADVGRAAGSPPDGAT
jgi:two-component system sensor histidine kinase KdpD